MPRILRAAKRTVSRLFRRFDPLEKQMLLPAGAVVVGAGYALNGPLHLPRHGYGDAIVAGVASLIMWELAILAARVVRAVQDHRQSVRDHRQ